MPLPLIPPRTLTRLLRTYDRSLQDTCQRMVYTTPSPSIYGTGTATYPAGAILRCLFRPVERQELLGFGLGGAQVRSQDVTIRFERDATISRFDRIKALTVQGGTVVTGTYEIIAGPVLDQVHYRALLRLVTDGSDV